MRLEEISRNQTMSGFMSLLRSIFRAKVVFHGFKREIGLKV
jgi:hypothetical protein